MKYLDNLFIINHNLIITFLFILLLINNCLGLIYFNEDDSQTLILLPNQTESISIISSNKNVEFSLISVHSQINKILLSYDDPEKEKFIKRDRKIIGLNIGLIVFFNENNYPKRSNLFLKNLNNSSTKVYIRILQYNGFHPIPGGCNLEFPVSISPFLRLKTTELNLTLEFQKASLGSSFQILKDHKQLKLDCDFSNNKFNYEIYSYYLKENDFSEQEFIFGLKRMSTVDSIEAYGSKLDNLIFQPKTRVQILAYKGKGVIYNVVVSFLNFKIAYTPVVSYDCDLKDSNSCRIYRNWFQILYFIVCGLIGLVICLDASRNLKLQILYFSFIIGTTIIYILITKYLNYLNLTNLIINLIILIGGLILSLFNLVIWLKYESNSLALILSGINLEFLFISIVLLSNFNIYQIKNSITYGILITITFLILPICSMFINLKKLNTICCSIFGSYMFIISIEQFFNGSLIYLTMNTINKIIYNDLFLIESNLPFQSIDYLITLLWFILIILSLFLNLFIDCDILITENLLINLKSFLDFNLFNNNNKIKKYEEIETVDNKEEDICKYNELSRSIIGSINDLDLDNQLCNTSFNSNSKYSSHLIKRINNNISSTKIEIPITPQPPPSLSSRSTSSRCSTPTTPKLNHHFKLEHLEYLNNQTGPLQSTPNKLLKNVVIQNARYSANKNRI